MFINPSQQPTTISFITLEEAEEEAHEEIENTPDTSVPQVHPPFYSASFCWDVFNIYNNFAFLQAEAPPSLSSLTRSLPVMEDPRPVNITATGDVNLPTVDEEIVLSPKDDAAEYDDSGDTQQFHDDPKYVLKK